MNNKKQNKTEDIVIKENQKPNFVKTMISGVLIGLLLVGIFFAGYFTHYSIMDKDALSLDFLLKIYKQNYYKSENSEITEILGDALVEGVMDKYSAYYTKEEYEKMTRESHGSRAGFGFSFLKNMEVYTVLGNSPAEKAGVESGDKIVAYRVGMGDFENATTSQAFLEYMQNYTEGENLEMKLERGGEILQVSLKSEEFDENYIYYTDSTGSYSFFTNEKGEMEFMPSSINKVDVKGDWGYIKLTSFDGLDGGAYGSSGQLSIALEKFKTNQKNKLIIDLRGNGGGYLSILMEMCSHFCYDPQNEGKAFLCQEAKYKDGKVEKFNSPASDFKNYNFKKIVFLADDGSASASEALMGAVLDYDFKNQTNIVNVVLEPSKVDGETVYKSYGKGIMQTTFVNDKTGEALKLTTAEIFWPVTKTSIHGRGITPELDAERVLKKPEGEDAILYAQTL